MQHLDLVVIGAGINGVGVAQFARAAGYSVLLLDRGKVGGQTSANSSKLIHGGLRYLESMQLDLVRKSLKARRDLLRLAPELVRPVPFYIPIYRHSRRSVFTIGAGLSLYGLLSEFDPLGRFQRVPKLEWARFNGLRQDSLHTVFQYWDAQTDDARLTRAVAASARELGALVQEDTEVTAIRHSAAGCELELSCHGETISVAASAVVNAAGPWVNELLHRVQPPAPSERLQWVQGAHLLLDIPAFDGIFYLESCFDKRVVFVMPWYGKTLIGTTETPIDSLASEPQVTAAEQAYLLGIFRHYFPDAGSESELAQKIVARFCGVRVLPRVASDAFDAPRDTLIHTSHSHPRLLSLYGGKLTTFRDSAAEVLGWVHGRLGARTELADPDKLMLHPAPECHWDDLCVQTR
ncbi:glycerol-3-phosphate dehydrogenase/oxidase [Shewanella cyperi]|uniref:glycerol-3-phosphate dehydrogenase/oxidase n=1 Tax=Shewanella cyperi TaxID=2814292 RepID=UPI001A9413CB|nr:FAD-dependent oxidoreductase [Shewanella cyperi]QSX41352.1 FAD-dependent oxidoreductase [Shewanella cyperi]